MDIGSGFGFHRGGRGGIGLRSSGMMVEFERDALFGFEDDAK